jgi:hypothetical protein
LHADAVEPALLPFVIKDLRRLRSACAFVVFLSTADGMSAVSTVAPASVKQLNDRRIDESRDP